MEAHTGRSRSIHTVHPSSQSGRRLWEARKALHLHEPNHERNGRSIHNSFCALQELTAGRAAINVSCMVGIVVKQPSCFHGMSVTFVAHGLTMKDAPPVYFGGNLDAALHAARSSRHDEEDYLATLER